MPMFSRFYSATEAEAAANIRRLFSSPADHTTFSSEDADQLAGILDGTTASTSRPRDDINQPLFRRPRPVQSVEQLLSASGSSLSQETVYRNKAVHYASSSEDDLEWKTRSRTPSSDEPSPRKYRIPSSTPSVEVEASSMSDGASDDGLLHAIGPTTQRYQYKWGQQLGYHAICPDNALQNMDTQFSKWSYDNNEGTTAIPFVMVNAPSDTHEQLVKIDRKLWVEGVEESTAEPARFADVAQAAVRKGLKQSSRGRRTPSMNDKQSNGPLSKGDVPDEDKCVSKRAALIAKSKATKDSSLVASKSVGQKRSAIHKNKNRRSIMPSPPPTARRPEPVKKPEPQPEPTRTTIYVLNQGEDEQRREVDTALQNKQLDFDNRQHLEELMHKINKAMADRGETTEARVIEEVDGDEAEQAEKTHRRKGKARKRAKKETA